MKDHKWYRITLTLGPIASVGYDNELRAAQRMARDLRMVAARWLALKGTRNTKSLRVDVERVEGPRA
jgi:hypothetical protein